MTLESGGSAEDDTSGEAAFVPRGGGDAAARCRATVEAAFAFRRMTETPAVLAAIEAAFAAHGATHLLVTGLPLPGRPLDALVLHYRAPEDAPEPWPVPRLPDPVLDRCLTAWRPFSIDVASVHRRSDLAGNPLAVAAPRGRIVAVPWRDEPAVQACVIARGAELAASETDLFALDLVVAQGFRRLKLLGRLHESRTGELSARERHIVALTATGATAQRIAGTLGISERTVNAHLQNAGEKLGAANKTQTVAEAVRYGQIAL